VLRAHGMCDTALQSIYRSVVIAKLLHASSAWCLVGVRFYRRRTANQCGPPPRSTQRPLSSRCDDLRGAVRVIRSSVITQNPGKPKQSSAPTSASDITISTALQPARTFS